MSKKIKYKLMHKPTENYIGQLYAIKYSNEPHIWIDRRLFNLLKKYGRIECQK